MTFPRDTTDMSNETIQTYLNDHLAIMTGELELVERVASSNASSPLGNFMNELATQLGRQRIFIADQLTEVGGCENPVKQAATWLAEKLGRVKPNGQLMGYSDLARVIEIETLITMSQARSLLWETLDMLDCVNATKIAESYKTETTRQRATLRDHHRDAMAQAFHSVNAS